MSEIRGKLPDGSKLLEADEIIKLKRCILGAKVTLLTMIFNCRQTYLEDITHKNSRNEFIKKVKCISAFCSQSFLYPHQARIKEK